MQKERRKQARQNNNTSAIKPKSKTFGFPSQGQQIILWAMSSQLFGRDWNSYQVGEVNCILPTNMRTQTGLVCWLNDLTTSQSEEHPPADHTHPTSPSHNLSMSWSHTPQAPLSTCPQADHTAHKSPLSTWPWADPTPPKRPLPHILSF